MDWSKAKTILIVSFLITNILLGVFVVSSDNMEDATLSEDFKRDVISMLNEKDIELNTQLPTINPSLPPIIVEYEQLKAVKINEDFFQSKGDIILRGNSSQIVYGREVIEIKNNKILSYKNNSEDIKYENLNKEKVEDIVKIFISNKNLDRDNMELTSITKSENVYIARFSKIYNDKYVERAYLNIFVDETGVKSAEKLWLEIIDDGEKEIYINTAPKAILSLLNMEEAKGRIIEDISICYYFDPEEEDYIEDLKDAKKGKTIPAWRVLFDDGNRIIIDNY